MPRCCSALLRDLPHELLELVVAHLDDVALAGLAQCACWCANVCRREQRARVAAALDRHLKVRPVPEARSGPGWACHTARLLYYRGDELNLTRSHDLSKGTVVWHVERVRRPQPPHRFGDLMWVAEFVAEGGPEYEVCHEVQLDGVGPKKTRPFVDGIYEADA